MQINKILYTKKPEILDYFRNRASESLEEIRRQFSETEYKDRAKAVNDSVFESKEHLLEALEQTAKNEKWDKPTFLKTVLLINYCSYVAMLEARNEVWPYEYMAFSRRIGELWEPFVALCWKYPISDDISLFIPPLFRDVKEKLTAEIETYIDKLSISELQKRELKKYYHKVWYFVSSGEIKLELDLHFSIKGKKYIVDLKSGFSSNEKGNTNRLLLVASIYKNLEENYQCLILVRSREDANNHYLQTLKKSKLWDVYCCDETYKQVHSLSGFDLKKWIDGNIDWQKDFKKEMIVYLKKNNLTQYLIW